MDKRNAKEFLDLFGLDRRMKHIYIEAHNGFTTVAHWSKKTESVHSCSVMDVVSKLVESCWKEISSKIPALYQENNQFHVSY
eukprot:TRINITY_DN4091_c0_g1_i1.p1 TRINITY_DN4091_c0_g1~~TRINITY_DN4091_c0_g1_i1.p1  ORF type:complete len:82 (+),score=8.32 TRINITY_DN4091_c0_g1_i1:377-622(+)